MSPNCTPNMTRIQVPIKLAFAITSNKSQGQSLASIGIYLNAGSLETLIIYFNSLLTPQVSLTTARSTQQRADVVTRGVLKCYCVTIPQVETSSES